MKYRKKLSKSFSKRNFTKKARVHRKNGRGRPMRGGIRL